MEETNSKACEPPPARHRWRILREALLKKNLLAINNDLIRFPSFSFIDANLISSTEDHHIFKITSQASPLIDLKIQILKLKLTRSELTGFNNTGNVCIWPSEECLARYCFENQSLFQNKDVIELGAGMTGLAGLVVAKTCKPKSVTISDGNQQGVSNMSEILTLNTFPCATEAKLVRWDTIEKDMEDRYDVVICSDCLFFDEYRKPLKNCIWSILRVGGKAFVMAPKRGSSFQDFVNLCKSDFSVTVSSDYSSAISNRIWELQDDLRCKEDTDIPLLIELTKDVNTKSKM